MGFSHVDSFPRALIVDENAYFSFTQTGSSYAMNLQNELTVKENAIFLYDRHDATEQVAAVRLRVAGAVVNFNNPQRVAMHNNAPAFLSGVGGTATMNINAGAVNLWDSKTSGIDTTTPPTRQWNKLGSNLLNFTVGFNSTNTGSIIGSNLAIDVDPVDYGITASTFLMSNYAMVLGQTPLSIDPVYAGDTNATGTAGTGTVYASYTTQGGTATAEDVASHGAYTISLAEPPEVGTRFIVDSFSDQLWSRQYVDVEGERPVLEFLSVPDIRFETTKIPLVSTFVKRADPNWKMIVRDTRINSPGFRVDASIKAPMTATVGENTYTITNDLVYVNSNGTHTPLSNVPVTVFSNVSGMQGNHDITWNDTEGLLMYVSPGDNLRAGVLYSTTITWTLASAP